VFLLAGGLPTDKQYVNGRIDRPLYSKVHSFLACRDTMNGRVERLRLDQKALPVLTRLIFDGQVTVQHRSTGKGRAYFAGAGWFSHLGYNITQESIGLLSRVTPR